MEPKPYFVGRLLQHRKRYCVPIYQRHYVWSRKKQWEPFWEDVRTKAVERLSNRPHQYPHFMGAVVLENRGAHEESSIAPIDRVDSYLVVDGQQRLMTFQLFLAAARDYAKNSDFLEVAQKIGIFLLNDNPHLMENPDVEELKVWPTQYDRELFTDIIRLADRHALKEKYGEHFHKRNDRIHDKNLTPRLIAGYGYFYDQIRHFVESDNLDDLFSGTSHAEDAPDDNPEIQNQANALDENAKRIKRETRLNAIWMALVEAFKVVAIILGDSGDAQVIFETLNERGEPLLAADLIRNNIFQRANASDENAEMLFEQHWKEVFEDPSWSQDEKQGRYKKARIDFFLANFIAGQIAGEVSLTKLFSEYKALQKMREQSALPSKDNPHPHPRRFSTIVDELEELGNYGRTYQQLVDHDAEGILATFAKRLRPWEVTTVFPLVLRLWQHPTMADDEKHQSLEHLMTFIVRRAVCGLTTKNYNKFFLNVVAYLDSKSWNLQELVSYLTSQQAETARIPSNEEFASCWIKEPLYQKLRSSRVRQILEELECAKRTKFHEASDLQSGLSVEHILPEAWVDYWPLVSGEVVTTEMQQKAQILGDLATEDDPVVSEIAYRDKTKHTIGNLTLLTQPLNSSVRNAAFGVKKDALTQHSLLVLNRDIVSREAWNESEIEARSKELFELALQIWPYPKQDGSIAK